jgi:hypothetical protein
VELSTSTANIELDLVEDASESQSLGRPATRSVALDDSSIKKMIAVETQAFAIINNRLEQLRLVYLQQETHLTDTSCNSNRGDLNESDTDNAPVGCTSRSKPACNDATLLSRSQRSQLSIYKIPRSIFDHSPD